MDTHRGRSVADPAQGRGQHRAWRSTGFDGPLALLLALARAKQIDLARLSLLDLLDQLAAALQQAGAGDASSARRATGWSWRPGCVLLRSRLLLPADDGGPAGGRRRRRDRLRERSGRSAGGAGARCLARSPAAARP